MKEVNIFFFLAENYTQETENLLIIKVENNEVEVEKEYLKIKIFLTH